MSGRDLHQRCGICNKVSSRDIETNAGEWTKESFVSDSDSHRMICLSCKESIEEAKLEYERQDDVWGNKRKSSNDNDDLSILNPDNPETDFILLTDEDQEFEEFIDTKVYSHTLFEE